MYTDAAFLSLLVLFIFRLACCFTHIHTKEVRKEYSINGKLPQNRVITFFSLTITIANWFVRFLFCTNFLQCCKKEGKSCTTIESTRFIFRIYIYIHNLIKLTVISQSLLDLIFEISSVSKSMIIIQNNIEYSSNYHCRVFYRIFFSINDRLYCSFVVIFVMKILVAFRNLLQISQRNFYSSIVNDISDKIIC